MRILLIISCLVYSLVSSAENADLHKLSLGLPQPKLRTLSAHIQQQQLVTKPLVKAILWEATPYSSTTKVNSIEVQQAVDNMSLEILLEAALANDPSLCPKSNKITNKLLGLVLGVNLTNYNAAPLQQLQSDIAMNYAGFKDYYQPRPNRNENIIQKHNSAKQHLVRLCGVEAVQQVTNLWHQDSIESQSVNYTKQAALDQYNLKISRGRISIIDLGTLIKGPVILTDDKLAKVYILSGLDAEDKQTILAVHGLKDSGEADLSVATARGVYHLHLLATNIAEDLICNPGFSRSKIYDQVIELGLQRSVVVTLPEAINQYVLAGDVSLFNLDHLHSISDPQFLRSFVLSTTAQNGLTDLVIASRKGVFKISINIKKENNCVSQNNINLGD